MVPTHQPSGPTVKPSRAPTPLPTLRPTLYPTAQPSLTITPTLDPSEIPTPAPTLLPTIFVVSNHSVASFSNEAVAKIAMGGAFVCLLSAMAFVQWRTRAQLRQIEQKNEKRMNKNRKKRGVISLGDNELDVADTSSSESELEDDIDYEETGTAAPSRKTDGWALAKSSRASLGRARKSFKMAQAARKAASNVASAMVSRSRSMGRKIERTLERTRDRAGRSVERSLQRSLERGMDVIRRSTSRSRNEKKIAPLKDLSLASHRENRQEKATKDIRLFLSAATLQHLVPIFSKEGIYTRAQLLKVDVDSDNLKLFGLNKDERARFRKLAQEGRKAEAAKAVRQEKKEAAAAAAAAPLFYEASRLAEFVGIRQGQPSSKSFKPYRKPDNRHAPPTFVGAKASRGKQSSHTSDKIIERSVREETKESSPFAETADWGFLGAPSWASPARGASLESRGSALRESFEDLSEMLTGVSLEAAPSRPVAQLKISPKKGDQPRNRSSEKKRAGTPASDVAGSGELNYTSLRLAPRFDVVGDDTVSARLGGRLRDRQEGAVNPSPRPIIRPSSSPGLTYTQASRRTTSRSEAPNRNSQQAPRKKPVVRSVDRGAQRGSGESTAAAAQKNSEWGLPMDWIGAGLSI